MKEIQALHIRQKEEIDTLFTRLGKPPPSAALSPAVAMAGGRRRPKSKGHKSARSSGQPSPLHSGKDTVGLPGVWLSSKALFTSILRSTLNINRALLYDVLETVQSLYGWLE